MPPDMVAKVQEVLARLSGEPGALLPILHALQDALPRQSGEISASDQQALRDILSQPPFAVDAADNWLAQLIAELLRRLFGGTVQTAYDGRYVIVILGAILIALVIGYFVYAGRQAAPDLPSGVDINLSVPSPPPMPEGPKLPDAPIPVPK